MNTFFDTVKNITKNPLISLASEGLESSDVPYWVDTGSYIVNAILSGSIFKGLPGNKVTCFAGESATGKTFFALSMCKNFLDANPEGNVIYCDTELAITQKMLTDRGIPTDRMIFLPIGIIEEWGTQMAQILDEYKKDKDKKPLLCVLDSMGGLVAKKQMENTLEGHHVANMQDSKLLKAALKIMTFKCGEAEVPLVITQHTYDAVGSMYATKEIAGGKGLKYLASSIIFLGKKKEKVGTEVIGNIIHCKTYKSRFTIENRMVDTLLTYEKGLDKYYGLLDIATKYDIIKKVANRFEIDGKMFYGKEIYKDPERFFTEDLLNKIDKACEKEFSYGDGSHLIEETDEEVMV